MGPAACRSDFMRLPAEMQAKLLQVLTLLAELKMPCRCEAVGREIHLTVARGLSPAPYWLGVFQRED